MTGQIPKAGNTTGPCEGEDTEVRERDGASNHGTDAWIPHALKVAEAVRERPTSWCPAGAVIPAAREVEWGTVRAEQGTHWEALWSRWLFWDNDPRGRGIRVESGAIIQVMTGWTRGDRLDQDISSRQRGLRQTVEVQTEGPGSRGTLVLR